MRILILNYEFPPLGGGAGNATANTAKELVRLGAQVAVLTSHYPGLPYREERDGYRVYRVPVVRRHLERCSPWEMGVFVGNASLPALWLARSFRPDILHVYFGIPTGPLGLLVKRALNIPYLLSLRGGDVPGFLAKELGWTHRLTRPIIRMVWAGASAILANSQGLAQLAQRSAPGREVVVIPNGVDMELFRPAAGERADGRPLRLLFVGRLVEQKGVRYLLEGLAHALARSEMEFQLEIVGSGPAEAGLQALTTRLGLKERVRFLGWLGRSEVAERYRAADVFVFPSFEEGMPNVVLEAMACGLPVIATDIYGNRELVREGQNGLLVPTMDSEAMGVDLVRLALDGEARRAMGRCSRALAEGYAWRKTAQSYLALSEEIAAGGRK